MKRSARLARGFTLIEIVIVMAIIGLLASVALPKFARATLRSRTSERSVILNSITKVFQDYGAQNGFPAAATLTAYNPPWPPGTAKRVWNPAASGWQNIPLVVEGACYYSYLVQYQQTATGLSFTAWAAGDLDGDGLISWKWYTYAQTTRVPGTTGAFVRTFEFPAAGAEDDSSTYGTF